MDKRRELASWCAGMAASIVIERSVVTEVLAALAMTGAVYFALGYLREGK